MLAPTAPSTDEALADLARAIASVRSAASAVHGPARADAICAALRASDELTATAVGLLAGRAFEDGSGLAAEMMLALDARRTGPEARMLTRAAGVLESMPRTAAAFGEALVSWGQVRAITLAAGRLDPCGRRAVDELVGSRAVACATDDPEHLLGLVDDEVLRLRADLALAREDRSADRGFLAIQGRLDGRASFYGEGDSCSVATMVDALDAAAPAPENPEAEGARSRAAQRFDALVGICEAYLAGETTATRPRPRLLAVVDAKDLLEGATGAAARVLWALAGRSPRLTSVAAEVLACDAQVVPVVFDRSGPVAVGDALTPVSGKVRTALVARDQGCRFPGCGAPASWCEGHHIDRRGGSKVRNLVLLCRRCHRRVHRHRWRISPRDDGTIVFSWRGRSYTSPPRFRPPPRE